MSPGSSPLARGLPVTLLRTQLERRIIPARAGFTGLRVGARRAVPDHPRSRGVYSPRSPTRRPTKGSSPLARGLRPTGRSAPFLTGIIPARAGFTPVIRMMTRPRPDHPRSRGVYAGRTQPGRMSEGSSPLARGLRVRGCVCAREWRIIPARAGFTGGAIPAGEAGWDHPRSRGVYTLSIPPREVCYGSSPLARGLHEYNPLCTRPYRIIPARAGFTDPACHRGARRGDHPRSRGVYQTGAAAMLRRLGSSPLARGLRGSGHGSALPVWIIPARAGFT